MFSRIIWKSHVRFYQKWPPNPKQFCFIQKSSCGHLIFILSELMWLSKRKPQQMYVASIDASKAFDKVNRNIKFHKLFEMAGHTITTTLMAYYSYTKAFVLNNNLIPYVFMIRRLSFTAIIFTLHGRNYWEYRLIKPRL